MGHSAVYGTGRRHGGKLEVESQQWPYPRVIEIFDVEHEDLIIKIAADNECVVRLEKPSGGLKSQTNPRA